MIKIYGQRFAIFELFTYLEIKSCEKITASEQLAKGNLRSVSKENSVYRKKLEIQRFEIQRSKVEISEILAKKLLPLIRSSLTPIFISNKLTQF